MTPVDRGSSRTLLVLLCLAPLALTASPEGRRPAAAQEVESAAPGPGPAASATPGYADDRTCGTSGCHDELYRTYQETDKGRSFFRPRPDRVLEDSAVARFFHEPSQRHYELSWRGRRLVFRRYQLDRLGRPINELEQEVAWVQGAGTVARVFFYQMPDGEIYQLPLAWWTEDRRWGMAPGFDRADHKGIRRRVRRECYFCHNAYPDQPAGADAYDAPQVFPAELPEGIGCQRCHGPGAEHARLALAGGSSVDELRDAILDPGWLPGELLNDLCYQCHARRSPASLPRFGRGAWSFRPGEPLAEYLVQVDAEEAGEKDSGRIETYPHFMMEESRCFQESRERMDCTTCHDSHQPVPEPQTAHYRAICNRCHPREPSHFAGAAPEALVPGAAVDDCVACHMPKRPTDTSHLALSDHSIPRRPDLGRAVPKRDVENPVYVAVDVVGLEGDLAQLYRAAAVVQTGSGPRAVDTLAQLVAAGRPEELDPYLILIRGLLQQRRWAEAERTLATVLERAPDNALALEWLGIARGGLGRRDDAMAAFRRVLERNPQRVESRFNLGLQLLASGRLEEGTGELERAVALRPNLVAAWFYLGNAYSELGRLDEAVERYRRALALEPSHSGAYLAIGQALLRRGERDEALRYLRHGAEVADRPQAVAEALAGVAAQADERRR